MKFLILLLVIVVVGWLTMGRRRKPPEGSKAEPRPAAPGSPKAATKTAQPEPQAMLACVHCGVHLPQAEAMKDAAGRPFCSEAHRLAGPR